MSEKPIDPLDERGPDGVSERWKREFIPPRVRKMADEILAERDAAARGEMVAKRKAETARAFYGFDHSLKAKDDPSRPGKSLDDWREWIRLLWLMLLAKDHPLAASLVESVEVIHIRHDLEVRVLGRLPAVPRDRGKFGGGAFVRIENLLCGVLDADAMMREMAREHLRALENHLAVQVLELL